MNRAQRVEALIKKEFNPDFFELVDESHQHAGRAGQESHFKILVVSKKFEQKNRVQRQRLIHGLLDDEFKQGLHALSLRLLTAEEYAQQVSKFETPNCQGNSSEE